MQKIKTLSFTLNHQSRVMTQTLDVEDWIDLSRFYLFDCEPNQTAEKGLNCIAILCEKAPVSKMLYDLVKFFSVAFYNDRDIIHRLSQLLKDKNAYNIVRFMKYNYQNTVTVAKRLKKRSVCSSILSRLQNDYLSYGLFYNLTHQKKSDSLNIDTFKLLLSWDYLHCKLMHPLWNVCFSDVIKNYGVDCCTMFVDEFVYIPVSLLTEFLSILTEHRLCKSCIKYTSKLVGIIVDSNDHKITLSYPKLHNICLRAILLFLCLSSFCIDLSKFQIVLHENADFCVWKVLDLFKVFYLKLCENEQFYDLLYYHLTYNLGEGDR
ncbi:hypothetical protein P9112_010850 [Eukaryota sp. TZLM1-RC]